MKSNLRPLVRSPQIGELAYGAIRDLLIGGTLGPDTRVVETSLTVSLGISRTPVREALARLANEGFLLATPQGYRVPTITASDIHNMSQVRSLLEPEAASQAAKNPDSIGLADMRKALAAAQRAHAAHDGDGVVVANTVYREAWLKRVRNPMLLGALTKVMGSLQLIRRRTMADALLRDYILEMQDGLLARIERRDASGAAAWQFDRVWGLDALIVRRLFPGDSPSPGTEPRA